MVILIGKVIMNQWIQGYPITAFSELYATPWKTMQHLPGFLKGQ